MSELWQGGFIRVVVDHVLLEWEITGKVLLSRQSLIEAYSKASIASREPQWIVGTKVTSGL